MANKEEMLRKVRLLLDKADSTTFEEEADTYRQKADALMLQYAIESYEVDEARREATKQEEPELGTFFLCFGDNPIKDNLMQLFFLTARHARCQPVVFGSHLKTHTEVIGKVVGFPTDVRYAEWMYTNLWAQMTRDLEPKPDPALSFEENVIAMMESGVSRKRIAELMHLEPKKVTGKMSRIYAEHYEATTGMPYRGKGTRPLPITYQRNFARGFTDRVEIRLYDIRRRSEEQVKGASTSIVLRSKQEDVLAVYRDLFPKLGRPYRPTAKSKFDANARLRGREAADRADLGQTRVGGGPRKELGS